MLFYSGNHTLNESYEGESILSDIDTPSIFEGKYDYTLESTMRIVAESEMNYTTIMKAIGQNELNAYVEGVDYMSLNEAGGGVIDTIISFLKNLWEKIKAIFRKFIAMLDAQFKSNKDFIKKYRQYISRPNVMKDFKYSGYKFTLGTAPTYTQDALVQTFKSGNNGIPGAVAAVCANIIDHGEFGDSFKDAATNDISKNDGSGANYSNDEEAQKGLNKFDEDFDKWEQTTCKEIYNTYKAGVSGGAASSPDSIEELTKDLFELYRDGDSAKRDLDDSDITSSYLLTTIGAYDKIKKEVDKVYKNKEKDYKTIIKNIEKASNNMLKEVPTKSGGDTIDAAQSKRNELRNQILVVLQRAVTFEKNADLAALNCWLKALEDELKQAKAICVQLVGRGTNVKESYEGYDNGYSSYSEGGYASAIKNLKLI